MKKINWINRDIQIVDKDGNTIFEKKDVQAPDFWSQRALNIFASHYMKKAKSDRDGEDETSIVQSIRRVVNQITEWGDKGYFRNSNEKEAFSQRLYELILFQKGTFNSPVWYNVGIKKEPQCSACFINSVKDSIESITFLAKKEIKIFKQGSGSGVNFSAIRGRGEPLSSGGTASGPVSFMRGYDSFAGAIKSGGASRRAAKIAILDIEHPDIEEFINCKVGEEAKAQALIEAGYDGSIDGEAYQTVQYQNANNSVRIPNEFMTAVNQDGDWNLRSIVSSEIVKKVKARDLLHQIAKATHQCGDPGVIFSTQVNNWNTCKTSGDIQACNPCSEFMFLDDSACNLASLNLLAFLDESNTFDVTGFKEAVETFITAQDIIVHNASYPTERIKENSIDFRPLGLGFANLGGFLMAQGIPYASEKGKNYAAAITALMTGFAYQQSAKLAKIYGIGPFKKYYLNDDDLKEVIEKHWQSLDKINSKLLPLGLMKDVLDVWERVKQEKEFRNAQVTLIAPTGTTGITMDCDTTGIEPAMCLTQIKDVVGGSQIIHTISVISRALTRLRYSVNETEEIEAHIKETGTVEGAPYLRNEHIPVFDCALQAFNGGRVISPRGHLEMVEAVQPFVSGSISKTVNIPNETTVEEIEEMYIQAYQMGLKAVSIYREGSKNEPVKAFRKQEKPNKEKEIITVKKQRNPLENERKAIIHKFVVGGQKGYLTVGLYEDGKPGELFLKMAKEGSTVSGLLDSFALATSLLLQNGVKLEKLVDRFKLSRFDPSGLTQNREIPAVSSILDYVFRWLEIKFLSEKKQSESNQTENLSGEICGNCGGLMRPNGACHICLVCGFSNGCG
jgi:ribonucleoside-diphosphate reductase alpha chain